MKTWLLLGLSVLLACAAHGNVIVWTNTAGGSWQTATNWSPNAVPGAADKAILTNAGTYTVVVTNDVTVSMLNVGGPGSPTLLVDRSASLACTNNATIAAGGTLLLSNAWLSGAFTIQSGAQMVFAAPGNTFIYNVTITNQGTVNWTSGSITIGGTAIYNSGLWQISGNNSTSFGGGTLPIWVNSGILRKVAGTGTSGISSFNFLNQPGGLVDLQTGTLTFSGAGTNPVAGLFTNALGTTFNFLNGTWTDAGGSFAGAGTNLFLTGTFQLRTNPPPGLLFVGGDVWVNPTFQQAGAITNLSIDGANLRGTNTVAGTLNFTSGSIPEQLTILPTGQWNVSGPANKLLYGLTLFNQGTVLCGGSLNVGTTVISNGGLWQITGDYSVAFGGGAIPVWTNAGTLRKSAGTDHSTIDGTFVNLPGALVEGQAARLIFNIGTASQFGGTFKATTFIDFNNGTWTDAGGVATGPGTNRFFGSTLNLRTNTVPGLMLLGGTVNITGTNTFQNAGAITNLTLDGATLAGTNTVSGGTLTVNSGAVTGQLNLQPDGQLLLTGNGSKFLYPLNLFNRGTVLLNGGASAGNTVISNGGLWQITGDYALTYGGVGTSSFLNSGLVQKTSGSGVALNNSVPFINQTNGVVQVDSGTLQLPSSSTNLAGILRLNGGTLNANGTFYVSGGALQGTGTFGGNAFSGGMISPGTNGAGLLAFSSGLNLNSNVTLLIDGSGPVPGTMYDQLSVTGAVVLNNCSLQVTSMPTVPAGTTFTLIANDGTDPVTGTFNGLPENATLDVGTQTFRIHYAGGTGNDVTLVRDGKVVGPTLAAGALTNGTWFFNGSGAIPLTPYTIRATTNFVTWTNLGVVTSSISGTLTFVDTNAWRYSRRFYNTTN